MFYVNIKVCIIFIICICQNSIYLYNINIYFALCSGEFRVVLIIFTPCSLSIETKKLLSIRVCIHRIRIKLLFLRILAM